VVRPSKLPGVQRGRDLAKTSADNPISQRPIAIVEVH
jgi:hypothetical protein